MKPGYEHLMDVAEYLPHNVRLRFTRAQFAALFPDAPGTQGYRSASRKLSGWLKGCGWAWTVRVQQGRPVLLLARERTDGAG